MKNRVINFLRMIWRNFGLRELVLNSKAILFILSWKLQKASIEKSSNQFRNSVLIIPSDPELLTSSLGDQAMIGSIMDWWSYQLTDVEFSFVVNGDIASKAVSALGAKPILLDRGISISNYIDKVKRRGFSHVILMGADGLDGSYDPLFSVQQILMADVCSRAGSEVFITGFSVSKKFNKLAALAFELLTDRVRVCLRDPLSLVRFHEKVKDKGEIVADVAFLLNPGEVVQSDTTLAWIECQHANEMVVIGFNAHPLLLELEERNNLDDLVDNMSSMLQNLLSNPKIAIVFLNHDSRGKSSDSLVINSIYDKLMKSYASKIFLPMEIYGARQIKSLVSHMDAVVTGRMHLMIGCVGVNTPVLGIDYKDKMEGLLQHLKLDSHRLLTARDIMADPVGSSEVILQFISEIPALRDQLIKSNDFIKNMSIRNFSDV